MSRLSYRRIQSEADILAVSRLAHEIWREHYKTLLTPDKLEYMLEKMLLPDPIRAQIAAGYIYSFVLLHHRPVGFIAYRPDDPAGKMFVSKIYLRREERGKGYFRQILAHLCSEAATAGQKSLWLTVARTNPSQEAYKAVGFVITEEKDTDIGGGYQMLDYVMEYTL